MPSAREYEPGHGQGHAPRSTAPPPRPSPGWWSGRRGRRPVVAPGLRQRDVLTRRGDPRGGHHREIPGNRRRASPSREPRANSTGRGLAAAKVPVSSSQPCRAPGDGGAASAATPRTLAGDRASTGHMWITIWRRYGRDPFRTFSQPSQPNGICAGNRRRRRQGLPGHVRWRRTAIRRAAQFIDESCAQPLHS